MNAISSVVHLGQGRREMNVAVIQQICASILESGKLVRCRIVGACMRGVIEDGEAVLVARADISNIQVGDVVAFFDGVHLVCHRVVNRRDVGSMTTLVTQGDHFPAADLPITSKELVGLVVAVEKPHGLVYFDGE